MAIELSDPLELQCERCQGDGVVVDIEHLKPVGDWPEIECSACRGIGFIPTEQGKALLRFVRRFVDPEGGVQIP